MSDHDIIVERLAGIARELTGRMDRLEDSTNDRIDRLDASINGRFGRMEKRVGSVELAQARAQGAAEERELHGLAPAARLPPPAGTADAVAVGTQGADPDADLPRWVRATFRLLIALGGCGAVAGALVQLINGGGP